MDKNYIKIFKSLSQNMAAIAETVMEYDEKQGDKEGLNTATVMRGDFQELSERITDDYQMTKTDAIKFYLCCLIQANQMQDKITNLQKSLSGYQTDLIPKLKDIIDSASTDEEASEIANQKFVIDEK